MFANPTPQTTAPVQIVQLQLQSSTIPVFPTFQCPVQLIFRKVKCPDIHYLHTCTSLYIFGQLSFTTFEDSKEIAKCHGQI